MEQYQNNKQLLLKCLGLLVNLTSSSRVCACVCMSGSWARTGNLVCMTVHVVDRIEILCVCVCVCVHATVVYFNI